MTDKSKRSKLLPVAAPLFAAAFVGIWALQPSPTHAANAVAAQTSSGGPVIQVADSQGETTTGVDVRQALAACRVESNERLQAWVNERRGFFGRRFDGHVRSYGGIGPGQNDYSSGVRRIIAGDVRAQLRQRYRAYVGECLHDKGVTEAQLKSLDNG